MRCYIMMIHFYSVKGPISAFDLYGASPNADYYLTDLKSNGWGSSFAVCYHDTYLGAIELPIPGHHNAVNALAAIAVGNELGIAFDAMKQPSSFQRRQKTYAVLREVDGVVIIDDYAHHPTEIEATISAVRQFHDGRLIAVFQPHRYSRTSLLGEHFGGAFQGADLLIVTRIYSAGEKPMPGINGKTICKSVHRHGCKALYIPKTDDIVEYLLNESRPGDVLLFMGAGDIWKTGEKTKLLLEGSHPSA